jgi:hypothetical protein
MIFHMFVAAIFFGIAILLGIFGVIHGRYRSGFFQPPDISCDSAARSRSNRICAGDD